MALMRSGRRSSYKVGGGGRGMASSSAPRMSPGAASSPSPFSSGGATPGITTKPLSATSPQQVAALPRLDRAPIVRTSSAGMGGRPIMGRGERYPGAGRYKFQGGNAYPITS